jgi:signal transduction histidine kinase
MPPPPPGQGLAPDMVAVLAHELRAPLAALRATVEVLDTAPDLTATGEHLRRLERSVGWLEGLVENVTLWAQLEDGGLALATQPLPLRTIVEDAAALVAPVLERKRQRVRLQHAADDPVVLADSHRLGRVVVNLLLNAGAYGPADEAIEVQIGTRDGGAEVRVVDRGPGVPPRERERIWERYARGRAGKNGAPGMGLGLHIVRELVRLHGGRVGIDRGPSGGAAFWVWLPLHQADSL